MLVAVFLLLCSGEILRKIMILAHSLDMGNGEFVFLNVNLIESQSEKDGLSWYKQNDKNNRVSTSYP